MCFLLYILSAMHGIHQEMNFLLIFTTRSILYNATKYTLVTVQDCKFFELDHRTDFTSTMVVQSMKFQINAILQVFIVGI